MAMKLKTEKTYINVTNWILKSNYECKAKEEKLIFGDYEKKNTNITRKNVTQCN